MGLFRKSCVNKVIRFVCGLRRHYSPSKVIKVFSRRVGMSVNRRGWFLFRPFRA